MYTSKWLGFVCAIWVQAIAGNNYTFANYSNALKSIMSLSQLQLNNLSVAKDVGKAFGLLSGLASDRLPTSLILIIGGLEGLIAYGAQWIVVSKTIAPLPYWQMCVFLCMGGNSTTWMNTAVLVTCMRNFKDNQGPVSGILKGYLGLSTAIFTDLCSALFSSDPSAFLLTLSLIPAFVCLLASFFLRETPPSEDRQRHQSLVFHFFNAVAVTMAVSLSVFDLTGNHNRLISFVFVIGLLLLLVTPLVVPLYFMVSKSGSGSDPRGGAEEPLLIENVKVVVVAAAEDVSEVVIGEDHTIFEALSRFEFWVLFVSFLCGVGTGLCVSNNLGQIGEALGYGDVSIFISLTSIWGFFGRIVSGMASEYSIRKFGMPRPIWNAMSQILMIVGYIVMAIGFSGSLYIGSILVGMCYGVRLAVTVTVTSDLFGLRCYGLLYNVLILNLPLGSFLFSGLLAGYLYDAQAVNSGEGGNVCVGPHCYRVVFVVMAVAGGFGFLLDMLLVVRTRKVYVKIFERHRIQTLVK